MKRWSIWVFLTMAGVITHATQRVEVDWPTPHRGFVEGRPPGEYLQHAGSGDPQSGAYGGVRGGGAQFHEGIDIVPTKRDRRGEATDPIFAALDGVVRHVSPVAGHSSYGRYVVLEHPGVGPAIYTLYSHLASVAPGLRVGTQLRRGDTLGVMGRSAGGYVIPRERAHLHFEMGLMLTRDFQNWYHWKKFGSPNHHGLYNGMNLMGFDPLDFYQQHWEGRVKNFHDYLWQLEPVVKFRIATLRTPDFVERYPELVEPNRPFLPGGWEVWCDWTGLPFRWRALNTSEVVGMRPNEVRLVEVNEAVERRQRSKTLAVQRRGEWVPGEDLRVVLQLVFGLR